MELYCCACAKKIEARLTDGTEIYPHRKDLRSLPFWKCDTCKNYVGCHHKTKNRTQPLGIIPTKELRAARGHIHKIVDPLWESGKVSRNKLYAMISKALGWQYHTAMIRSVEEAREVYAVVKKLSKEF